MTDLNIEGQDSNSGGASESDSPKRRWRNYLLNRQFQLKFSLYFIAIVLAVVGVMMASIFSLLLDLRLKILEFYGADITLQAHIDKAVFEITIISLLILAGFSVMSFFYSLIITHRIAGPIMVICRYIDDLKAGKYEGNRHLRYHDELKPIMTGLNELAEILKQNQR